jgi:phosphoadenosine phosphosulfate reductase
MKMEEARVQRALNILREADALAQSGVVSLATSLSAEDMVLTHLVARHDLNIKLFVLDTGMLHAETLGMIDTVKSHYGLSISIVRPDPEEIAGFVGSQGAYSFYESLEARKTCCHIRKVVPLNVALAGHAGWVTGQRRDGAISRSDLEEIEFDAVRNLQKYNPLAGWSWEDVLLYVKRNDVPINPLYGRGYVSIGCEPCTRALRPGEDPRAARWWWENNDATKECGLHMKEVAL